MRLASKPVTPPAPAADRTTVLQRQPRVCEPSAAVLQAMHPRARHSRSMRAREWRSLRDRASSRGQPVISTSATAAPRPEDPRAPRGQGSLHPHRLMVMNRPVTSTIAAADGTVLSNTSATDATVMLAPNRGRRLRAMTALWRRSLISPERSPRPHASQRPRRPCP